MKKKTVTVLIVIVLVLLIAVSGVLGYLWYMENHIFIEGAAYPINALELDLREKDISTAHYGTSILQKETSAPWPPFLFGPHQ